MLFDYFHLELHIAFETVHDLHVMIFCVELKADVDDAAYGQCHSDSPSKVGAQKSLKTIAVDSACRDRGRAVSRRWTFYTIFRSMSWSIAVKWMTATALALAAACGHAAYPDKPIRVIVPFPAGSATDILARVVGQKLTAPLGQNIVVDNRGGGSGSIGALAAARATPDGHTLILGGLSMLVVAPALNSGVGYTTHDFAPISNVVTAPYILVVHNQVAAASVKELIALCAQQTRSIELCVSGFGQPCASRGGTLHANGGGQNDARSV